MRMILVAEQYLTGITWAPESDMVYIQVLNRGQNHMRLNKYDASTGKLIATLFEEKSILTWNRKAVWYSWLTTRNNLFILRITGMVS